MQVCWQVVMDLQKPISVRRKGAVDLQHCKVQSFAVKLRGMKKEETSLHLNFNSSIVFPLLSQALIFIYFTSLTYAGTCITAENVTSIAATSITTDSVRTGLTASAGSQGALVDVCRKQQQL